MSVLFPPAVASEEEPETNAKSEPVKQIKKKKNPRAVSRFGQTKAVMKEKCCVEPRYEKQEGRE